MNLAPLHTFYPPEFEHAMDAFLREMLHINRQDIDFTNCDNVFLVLSHLLTQV